MILPQWTGREAGALRHASRMSLRAWADHLGVSARAASKWERLGAASVPRPHMQAILDLVLARADADAQERFAALLNESTAASQCSACTCSIRDEKDGSVPSETGYASVCRRWV